jgi:hypothetical protein
MNRAWSGHARGKVTQAGEWHFKFTEVRVWSTLRGLSGFMWRNSCMERHGERKHEDGPADLALGRVSLYRAALGLCVVRRGSLFVL